MGTALFEPLSNGWPNHFMIENAVQYRHGLSLVPDRFFQFPQSR
jgi:hypothetical protein